jgi:spore maturation protein CgeB
MKIKVLVSGAFPDALNRNVSIIDHVCNGFKELEIISEVTHSYYEQASTDIIKCEPNLVVMIGSAMRDSIDYNPIRYACNKISATLAFWVLDDPYEFDVHYKFFDLADLIFSNDKTAVDYYFSDKVFHLPTAASKQTHFREISLNKTRDLDIFFCGVGFPNRQRLFNDLESTLVEYNSLILGDEWDAGNSCIFMNRRIDISEIPDWYNRAWITINVGRNYDLANKRFKLIPSTPGPRTFEAAMAGTVQLYFLEDLEIEEYFEVGKEILTFETPQEFATIVSELLSRPEQMYDIAKACQDKALAFHTYTNRTELIVKIYNDCYLKSKSRLKTNKEVSII